MDQAVHNNAGTRFEQTLIPLTALERQQAGTKAAQLALLAREGLPVPAAFLLPADQLPTPGQPLSHSLYAELETALEQLGGRVAVRSSATEEDRADASWAGLFHTELNVTDLEGLVEAIHRCQQSLHSATCQQFRKQQGSKSDVKLAVLIQQQINAESAGVLFTRDPLHPERSRMVVNALRGLGEALVSGQESGDRYSIDLQGNRLSRQLHRQSRLLNRDGWRSIPTDDQLRSSLEDTQLQQLAALGRRLEHLCGSPQDIEFAFADGKLWLLQSRPIVANRAPDATQLKRFREQERTRLQKEISDQQRRGVLRQSRAILCNSNISELLPLPTPMSFALFRHLFTGEGGAIIRGRAKLGYRISPHATRELFSLVAGQPYLQLELDARTYDLRAPQPVTQLLQEVETNPSLANYPEFGLYRQLAQSVQPTDSQGDALSEACQQHAAAMRRSAKTFAKQYRDRLAPAMQRHRLSMQRSQPGHTPQALLIRISALIQHLQQHSCYHFVIAARLGFYFAERVRVQLQCWQPKQASRLMAQLLRALPGSAITEQLLDLTELHSGLLDEGAFLERYGHLAQNELEIAQPRFHEAPQLLQRLLGDPSQVHNRRQFRTQIRQRKGVERHLRAQLVQAGVSRSEIENFFADLRHARRYLPLRETIKYQFAAEYDLLRQSLLQLADRCGLDHADIFYLEPGELPQLLQQPADLCTRVERRRQQHRLAKTLAASTPLPALILSDQLEDTFTPPSAPPADRSSGQAGLQGEGIAPGIRRGRLRLIDESTDLFTLADSLHPDDILVTRSANLGLAPLLRRVAGLVVEVGGFLAHAACQAREAGIPALVLPGATRQLVDGRLVVLDGGRGWLQLE